MPQRKQLNRRDFLHRSLAAGIGVPLIAARSDSLQSQEVTINADSPRIKEYRTLGRTGFKVSDISSGGPQNEVLLKALLQSGVNYIDTAESYGRGQSETSTGNVVKEFDRKKLFVTTKIVVKADQTKETILARVRKCLERLQTDYVDCLMIHSPATSDLLVHEGFHEAAKQLKSEGRVRFLGVANHGGQWNDVPETMEQVLGKAAEDGRFDVFLMVYNFVQKEMGEAVLKVCQEKNIGVTLMKTNPVGGYLEMKAQVDQLEKEGKPINDYLRNLLPRLKEKADKAQAFIDRYGLQGEAQVRDAAIRFVLAHPGVHAACISFNIFDDLKTYVGLSGSRFTLKDKQMITQYRSQCSDLYCRHACGICEHACPAGVPVNTIMRFNHYFQAQKRERFAMEQYRELTSPKADGCLDCPGGCESACPFGVPVQGLLAMAHRRLSLA